ncbi:MAG TPA: RNA polymerase sigma-70 factor [Chitinophagaceae bacterium]|nr:RNA polymerase sigma-70 factor [Chitinophagaceae bacterium]
MKRYNKYSDQKLLSLLSLHDAAAFTELYNRYWQRLFALAINRLKDREAAEDIVHDVFASLWANRELIGIELLENYLAVAVKYAVFSKIKKKIREREIQQSFSDTKPLLPGAESSVHYKQVMEILKTEVEKLPEKCRLIFNYSRYRGMPVKEIASELHLSPKTVENQLGKALRHLRLIVRSLLQSWILLNSGQLFI